MTFNLCDLRITTLTEFTLHVCKSVSSLKLLWASPNYHKPYLTKTLQGISSLLVMGQLYYPLAMDYVFHTFYMNLLLLALSS